MRYEADALVGEDTDLLLRRQMKRKDDRLQWMERLNAQHVPEGFRVCLRVEGV
jgi:hypothetical protein